MKENNSVEMITLENSWNKVCYVLSYTPFHLTIGLLTQSLTFALASKMLKTFIILILCLPPSLFLAYAFTVLNSLQGVGIFVFQVRDA